jgi:hypothetical protein
MVPLDIGVDKVEFADYASARAAAGMEHARGIKETLQLTPEEWKRLYGGLPKNNNLWDYAYNLPDTAGLDLLGFDLGIWSDRAGFDYPNFMVLEGPLDREGIIAKLLELDYKEATYKGTAYYWLFEDWRSASLLEHPLRIMGPYLNRIAFVGDRLLVATTTEIMEGLIDVQRGEAPSLLDSSPYRGLAEAVGEEVLGGVFVEPQWIVDAWNPWDKKPAERLDEYLEGPDRWGTLSPYSLAFLGYRFRGDAQQVATALYYPDPEAAGNDAEELEKRWESFEFYPDATGAPERVSVSQFCSPFSALAIRLADSSVLVGSCPTLSVEGAEPLDDGIGLWRTLFWHGELQFLAPDLEELKEGGSGTFEGGDY